MSKDIGVDANIDRIRIKEVASPSTPASGYGYIYAKTDGLYYKGDNGTEIGPLASSTSANPYSLTFSEDGSSFTNFTAASGTWASDGTVIKQTNTAATYFRAKYNTIVRTEMFVYEAEIQLKNSGENRIGGIIAGFDGSSSNGLSIRLNEGANQVQIEADGQVAIANFSFTVTADTWYKLRACVVGHRSSIYIDGTLIGTMDTGNTDFYKNVSYVGLVTYQCEVWYRNIKAWNIGLPT